MSAEVNQLKVYEQPLVGRIEGALRNCLIGAGALGVAALFLIFLAPPIPVRNLSFDEIPERYAKLILKQPEPAAAAPKYEAPAARIDIPAAPAIPEPQVAEKPKPKAPPETRRRVAAKPKVEPDKGVQGRERAEKEVTQNLAQVTGSLDKALDDLTNALPAAGAGDKASQKKPARRQRRGTRGGRNSTQLASVGGVNNLKTADIGGTSLSTQAVAIAGISDLDYGGLGGSGSSGDGGSGSGNSGVAGRSNESLLAVVRRYAPGIQFCYENELKRDSSLRGKLVVSLTVAPGGRVTEVSVVENSLGSDAVVSCAVEQMHGWVFPAVESGTTTFKAPFVFTPPD